MSPPKDYISDVPIEILTQVLAELSDPPSVVSAALSCKRFYNAFTTASLPARRTMFGNYLEESLHHCQLVLQMNRISDAEVSRGSRIMEFMFRYLFWANPMGEGTIPSKDADSESILAVRPEERTQLQKIHEPICRWVTEFCSEKLRRNPLTGELVGDTNPSKTEFVRLTKAFYRWALFCRLIRQLRLPRKSYNGGESNINYDNDQNDFSGVGYGEVEKGIALAFVESVPFLEYKIVVLHIAPFFFSHVSAVVRKFIPDIRDKWARYGFGGPMFKLEYWDEMPEGHGPDMDRDEVLTYHLSSHIICDFGMEKLWSFLFNWHPEKQLEAIRGIPPTIKPNFRQYWLGDPIRGSQENILGYDPILSICYEPVIVGKSDTSWWQSAFESGKVSLDCIMWDDSRLEGWGFVPPIVRAPETRRLLKVYMLNRARVIKYLDIPFQERPISIKFRTLFFNPYNVARGGFQMYEEGSSKIPQDVLEDLEARSPQT
ncbi:hypothetical protein ABW19_dt0204664 [Dactylella cylindrospora]|nr:hypothetical protein ABW19_dt0204664 [Dactylella cylindrospora]